MGVLEQQLFDSTVPLIEAFERICQEITADPSFAHVPHELTKDFPTLLFNFLKNFKAWKVPDEIKLTHIVKHALIAIPSTRASSTWWAWGLQDEEGIQHHHPTSLLQAPADSQH